jgi:hypothetical protein
MIGNDNIPGTIRLLFPEVALAATAAQRRQAANLLRQYPGLTADGELHKLLNYYPVVGSPIADPRLPPEQVARQYIDAALEQRRWSGLQRVRREVSFRSTVTQKLLRVDYVLYVFAAYLNKYLPVAFVEAKSRMCVPADGLQQAKEYADHYPNTASIHFVFSTNGYNFVSYDRRTERTQKAKPLGSFPTPYSLAKTFG